MVERGLKRNLYRRVKRSASAHPASRTASLFECIPSHPIRRRRAEPCLRMELAPESSAGRSLTDGVPPRAPTVCSAESVSVNGFARCIRSRSVLSYYAAFRRSDILKPASKWMHRSEGTGVPLLYPGRMNRRWISGLPCTGPLAGQGQYIAGGSRCQAESGISCRLCGARGAIPALAGAVRARMEGRHGSRV